MISCYLNTAHHLPKTIRLNILKNSLLILNGIILTQGFHQGKLAIQTEIKEIDFKINLF